MQVLLIRVENAESSYRLVALYWKWDRPLKNGDKIVKPEGHPRKALTLADSRLKIADRKLLHMSSS